MRLVVIGLDCLEPSLVSRWKSNLPTISGLIDGGIFKKLKSTVPPITVPAWASMFTGKDPGELGIYGFRNRKPGSYGLYIPNSSHVDFPFLWEVASEAGMRCAVVNVPLTYPLRELNGVMVSSFLTPEGAEDFTYPRDFKDKLLELCGGDYVVDVKNFRTDDKEWLLSEIYRMTKLRFKLLKGLARENDWDLFIFVEMGPDRMHHGFWRFMDRGHRLYKPGNPYEEAIEEYYAYLDRELGELLKLFKGDCAFVLVSDHGAKRMEGALAINEVLLKEGFLKLKERPRGMKRLLQDMVDWSKTKAWAEGGYYSRVMVNLKGREPEGSVDKKDFEKVREELRELIESIKGPSGEPLRNRVFYPEDIYRNVKNLPPDLIVYFDDLSWRAAGSVGGDAIYLFENDTGPDDANHSQFGVFIGYPGSLFKGIAEEHVNIVEVFRIFSNVLGIGEKGVGKEQEKREFAREEEEEIAKRLSDLGYY